MEVVRFQAKLAPCDSRRIKGFVFFINKREGAANDPTNKYEIRSTITNTNGSPTTRHREGIVFPVISIGAHSLCSTITSNYYLHLSIPGRPTGTCF